MSITSPCSAPIRCWVELSPNKKTGQAGPTSPSSVRNSENRRFASEDPIGKVLRLGDDAYTVIGVLDTSFVEGDAPDLFLPLQADPLSTNRDTLCKCRRA